MQSVEHVESVRLSFIQMHEKGALLTGQRVSGAAGQMTVLTLLMETIAFWDT